MAKKEYAFYPGCSSQPGSSASNYLVSANTMCAKLGIKLTTIPDWNCCGGSISYAGAGEVPRHAMNLRNFALAEKHLPGQDIVATCAGCWLGARESKEKIEEDEDMRRDTLAALSETGLSYKGDTEIRHMVEVLIEDLGYEEMARPVVKPLRGMKFAGYVGCQTIRPFAVAGDSYESPEYLDRMIAAVGGEPVTDYEHKVACCGGSLAFSEPEKSQKLIREIVESAYDHGADMLVTPCPLCQANVELYQSEINRKQGTQLDMPVLYYSQLMAVAYGSSGREAGLNGNVIRAKKLEQLADAAAQ